jgi:hypothetical protein
VAESSDPLPRGSEAPGEDEVTVHLPELPAATRIVFLFLGGGFLLLGLIGLALPVFPQTVPLVLGAALLSVASQRVHDTLERWLNRWPRAAGAYARMRHRIHRWVSRDSGGGRTDDQER